MYEIRKLPYLSIIRLLNANKAHGWDEVSVRMVKICYETLVPPLQMIFQSSSDTGTFPNYWKRRNLTPIHKKEDKWNAGNIDRYLFFLY